MFFFLLFLIVFICRNIATIIPTKLPSVAPTLPNLYVCASGEDLYCTCTGVVYYAKKISTTPVTIAFCQSLAYSYLKLTVSGGITCSYIALEIL